MTEGNLPWIITTIIAAGGLILNSIVQIRGGAWNAADRDGKLKDFLRIGMDEIAKSTKSSVDTLRAETTQNLASLNVDLDSARRESQEQHDDTMSKFGDTVAALRQKVNDDALSAEKTYMRREDFNLWAQSQRDTYATLDRKVDDRFNRIETLLLNRSWPAVPMTPPPAYPPNPG